MKNASFGKGRNLSKTTSDVNFDRGNRKAERGQGI